ncbi:uncharacterized protein [Triticum aestivum]|uniref:uncharacterized protein n=1 Tax=Triticum aestivum TaxID=4565 RepID=UPI001D01A094|nr:uncharacterized protein LOC123091517 [Triticum aestivum]
MSRVDICSLVLHVFPTEPEVPLLPRSRSHSLPVEPDDGHRLAAPLRHRSSRPTPPPPPLSATAPPAPRRPRCHHPSRLTPHAASFPASFPNVKHAFFLSILLPFLSDGHVFTSPGHGSRAPSFLAFLARRLLGGLQRGRWRSSPSSPPESKAFEDRDKPAAQPVTGAAARALSPRRSRWATSASSSPCVNPLCVAGWGGNSVSSSSCGYRGFAPQLAANSISGEKRRRRLREGGRRCKPRSIFGGFAQGQRLGACGGSSRSGDIFWWIAVCALV